MMSDYASIWKKIENLPWCTLVASGRTGSDAFQSHLDSHPEIFLIPGAIFLHVYWKNSVTASFEGELKAEDIVEEFIGHHIIKLITKYDSKERRDSLGENMDQSITVPVDIFREHLIGLLVEKPLTSRYFVQAVYVAYALATGQDINTKKLFFDHVHHVRKVPDVIADFPECKIICMTRDPRAAYVSGVEHWRRYDPTTHNPSYPLYILQRIMDEPRGLVKYGENFRVMRLEDMSCEGVMQKACEWLGVSFRSEVMSATWGGLRWWGDKLSEAVPDKTMSEKEFSKAIRTNKWETKLRPLDKHVLNYLLFDRLKQCHYPCEEKSGVVTFALIVAAIFLPTTYERRDLSPKRLFSLLMSGQFRQLFGTVYHYLRRVIYYFKLLGRRLTGSRFNFPLFENAEDRSRQKPTNLKS
ncbi:MAG: sulfotransferase domain-containing protein [Rhodospirillales bacterium]|nr:sulfotransferase domain-containing protein [Rhodospirillales bacterium]